MITVYRLGNGWYDFSKVPQDNYIKIGSLCCGSDDKAHTQALKIISDKNEEVLITDRREI